MHLKPAKLAIFGASAVLLLISLGIAQDIGHLGVNDDPVPLVQAKRQRRFIVRNNSRGSNQFAMNRPDPGSRDLRADVSGIGGPTGKPSATPAQNSQGGTGAQLPSVKPTNNVAVASAAKPVGAVAGPAAMPAKAALSPFEEMVAKAEDAVLKGDIRAAAESYRQALTLQPDSFDARLGLADSLHDSRNYAGADTEFQRLVAQNPNSAEARRGRGDTLYELKKYDEAIAEYSSAIKAGAADAGVYNNLANAYFRSGTRDNRDLAVQNYRKAIEKSPDWPDAYAGLANALRIQKQLPEAQAAVEKSIQLAPNSSLARSVAGRVYADLRDFNRANLEAQKAVDLAPKDAFVYLNLAGIQYMQGRYNEAIRNYVAAQSYDRTWAVPYNSLGNLYLSINRPLEAAEVFETAAKLEPKNSTIHNNLGAAYAKLQKYDAAIANYQISTQLDPKNPNPLSNMGLAYVAQGRYNDAVTAFSRAVAIEPNNGVFQLALADSLNLAGKKKEAKEAYKRAESLGAKVKKK